MSTDTTSSAPMAGSASAVDRCKVKPSTVSVLGPSVYRLAMRRACAIVKALSEAEVQKMAQTILDSTDGSLNLTGKVKERLEADDLNLKRQGLAEFSVDNFGLDLSQQQREIDDKEEARVRCAATARQLAAGIEQTRAEEDESRAERNGPLAINNRNLVREVVVETHLTPDEAEMLRQEFLHRVNSYGLFSQFMNWLEPCQLKNMRLVFEPFEYKSSPAVRQQTLHLVAARRIFTEYLEEVEAA